MFISLTCMWVSWTSRLTHWVLLEETAILIVTSRLD